LGLVQRHLRGRYQAVERSNIYDSFFDETLCLFTLDVDFSQTDFDYQTEINAAFSFSSVFSDAHC
jgi:hypothetical protein